MIHFIILSTPLCTMNSQTTSTKSIQRIRLPFLHSSMATNRRLSLPLGLLSTSASPFYATKAVRLGLTTSATQDDNYYASTGLLLFPVSRVAPTSLRQILHRQLSNRHL